MAKQVKEVKDRLECYSVNLNTSQEVLEENEFSYTLFRGQHAFVKIANLGEDITFTILIIMDDSKEELTGVLDYTYMQRLNLGNPVLDDTPESVVSYMFEELDRLVDLDILEYKEPKKGKKK